MFFDERGESIYFHGDGIYCREAASDKHHAGINGLEDTVDEVEAVFYENEMVIDERQVTSDEREESSDEGEEASCEHEACIYEGADIADAGEDTSGEVEDVPAAFEAACNTTAMGFFTEPHSYSCS